jgi:Cu(I)/Ag(I) efflux system membrane protein CusA/SilA
VTAAATVLFIASLLLFMRLGQEFIPTLDEKDILLQAIRIASTSLDQSQAMQFDVEKTVSGLPEVAYAFSKTGTAESALDPMPPNTSDTYVILKPRDQWRPAMTWDRLIHDMDAKLAYPGMPNIFWMPIQTRTEMLSTGVRSPLGIEVFGDNIEQIEEAAVAIEKAVAGVPGTRSAFADRSTGGFYIDLVVKREAAARLGLTVGDVNDVIQAAIGGVNVSETIEGRERYSINVRYAREFRDDPAMLGKVLVATPMGAQIPLSQVVEIKTVMGPPMIRSEDGKLVGFVFLDTTRPMSDYVADAKRVIARDVELHGVRLAWVGQLQYAERANAKLAVVVPITLLIVFFLLYLNTRSLVETGIVLLAVPFSLVGAIWLVYLLHYNMSVAVSVGMIALAGLDAETGVVMLLYLTLAHRRWHAEGRLRTQGDLREAIVEGAAHRIRPKLMTVLTMMIGLVPVLWSTGTGADVMKRIAAPMVGGLVTSFLLELLVYPAVFSIWKGRRLATSGGDQSPGSSNTPA